MNINWNWGTKLVLAMAAFMLMVIAFVIFMMQQDISLVEADYYPRGQAHQEMIEKTKNTIPYAGDIIASVENNIIRVEFPAFFKSELVNGSVHFYHRTSNVNDRRTALKLDQFGVFSYPANQMKGRYILKIDWEQDNTKYYIEKNIILE